MQKEYNVDVAGQWSNDIIVRGLCDKHWHKQHSGKS
jgi:hypothetical protein